MSDHDSVRKSSWLTDEAPPEHEQTAQPSGEPGKRTYTDNLVNPNVPVRVSGLVQRWRASQGNVRENAAESIDRAASDSGSPLPANVREKFESSMGADLSNVRVHTGPASSAAAEAVGAKAYTTGNDIHFAAGNYDPSSREGQHLLAHEVAHTLQQATTPRTGPQYKLEVSEPGDALERQADAIAERAVAGQSAADLVGASAGAAAGVVQRKEGTPAAARDAASPQVTAPAAPAPDAAKNANAGKTVDLTLTAMFHHIPGKSTNISATPATAESALWFDPLQMSSNAPLLKENPPKSVGFVGVGQMTVDTFKAPVTDTATPIGRGTVTLQLKYAKNKNTSYRVTVEGKLKNAAAAQKAAKAFVKDKLERYGDVDDIERQATEALQNDYPGARVKITVGKTGMTDAGRRSFHYKVRSNAGILMNVNVAPDGEQQVKTSGQVVKEKGSEEEHKQKASKENSTQQIDKDEKDSWKKKESSKETHEVEYAEKVVKTIEDYVTKTTEERKELASDLSEVVTEKKHSTWEEDSRSKRRASNYTDYTKDSKHTVEEGDKEKSNWAAKLRKGVKVAKKATSIPFIDKIPVVGWVSRKIKGWGLDLIDEGLGLFAEEGKVHYQDTKLDEKVTKKDTIKDDVDKNTKVELKEHDRTETKRKLKEDFLSKTEEDWQRHMKEVEDVSKHYKSVIEKKSDTSIDAEHKETYKDQQSKDAQEQEHVKKQKENQTTSISFNVINEWKYTKPVLEATVFQGDAEVSNQPFPEDPAEKTEPASAAQKLPTP